MADVGVGRKLIAHLDDFHMLALLSQADCQLASRKAAAEDYDGIRHFFLFLIVIVDDHDVGAGLSLEAGNRRDKRS